MGKKAGKETHLQKSVRFQQQAATLQMKGLYSNCCQMLKERPDILPTVWQHICNLVQLPAVTQVPGGGGSSASSNPAAAPVTPRMEPPAWSPDGMSPAAACRPDAAVALASSPAAEPCLPNCYRSFEHCSVVQLKKFCAAVEPNLFGPFALKAMINRGSREVNKTALLKILEFTTGLDPSTSISSDERDVCSLERQLMDMNTRYGRRALNLNLPPDWTKQGVYSLYTEEDKKIYVGNRFDAQRRLLPDKFQEFPFDQIYIDFNWSDNRANVRVRGALVDQPVNMLFAAAKGQGSYDGPGPMHKKAKLTTLPCAPSPEPGLGEKVALADADADPECVSADTAAAEVEAALLKPLQFSKEAGFVPPGA